MNDNAAAARTPAATGTEMGTRIRLRRLGGVRLRLTLLYVLLFVAGGAALLGAGVPGIPDLLSSPS